MAVKLGNHVTVAHHPDRGTVTIELSEQSVMGLYASGVVFMIGGLIGLTRGMQRGRKSDKCECSMCRGLYRNPKVLGTGFFGEATLVTRQNRPFVLKKVGCNTVNLANQALQEAAVLQRLKHPNVVRFEDVFLHRHDNGGCSVSIVMEFCSGGDLIDRLECTRGQLALSELTVLGYLESLCHALHHVHCCGVLHRDLKSSNIFVSRLDREVKV